MEFDIRTGEDLGRAIRQLRLSRDLSQTEAAELVGLTQPYLSKIEGGRTVSLLQHELRILRRLGARVTVSFDDRDDGG